MLRDVSAFVTGAVTAVVLGATWIHMKYCRAAGNKYSRSTTASGSTVYESARAVDEYLQFHYSTEKELMPYPCGPMDALHFPYYLAKNVIDGFNKYCSATERGVNIRALDIGCAVGRTSFELTCGFDEVVGIDFSNSFIAAANEMKEHGKKAYVSLIEGEVMEQRVANLPSGIRKDIVSFEQGDACNLRDDIGSFDAVLASNLLCRLPDPEAFLRSLTKLVKPGGLVYLVSPYSWLEEYTSKNNWMGGRDDGPRSSDVVIEFMKSQNFVLLETSDCPFLIREHARKYQWGCSHGTMWRLEN